MKRPAPLRALDLCREYDQLLTRVVQLTERIAIALAECPRSVNATELSPVNTKGYAITHLDEAFTPYVDDFDEKEWPTEDEQREILNQCGYCSAAHDYIKERKAAKKRLGIVKRSIRLIGRNQ